VHKVDPAGLELSGPDDIVLDVFFDARRIWSFWLLRDSSETAGSRRTIAWPRALRRFLDGTTKLTVREHLDGRLLFEQELTFGSGTGRIAVENAQGKPVGLDKSGRLQMTFDTRTEAQAAPLLDSIELVLAALQKLGIDVFPAYGTLLGAVRDGALIGHDSDADLGYLSRHTHPVDVILESFELQRQLARQGFQIVRYSGAAFKVLVTEPDGNKRGLDVFGGFLADGHLVLMGEIRTPFRREWILPLGTTTLEGRTLPAPADTDRFLTATYGESWRVPDPAFRFDVPRSTTDRLNDWFRGTNVHRADWDRRYQPVRHQRPRIKPDVLAKRLYRDESAAPPDLVVDLGCGRGTNARWLARRGVRTLGLDFSARGYEFVERGARQQQLPLEFASMNLLEMRQVLGWGTRIARVPGRRVVLARHVFETLTPRGRDNFGRFCQMVCAGGGSLYLEFLSSAEPEDNWARRSMLVPLEPGEVEAALTAGGGKVQWSSSVASRQRAERRGHDPGPRRTTHRMVISWQ
jgi:hypothetical protein